VVPVLLSDAGADAKLAAFAAELGFAAIVFDTAAKDGRTLFDCVDAGVLSQCLALASARGVMTGIAGALGWAQLAQIRALAPDIAGFRTALCARAEGRAGRLDPVLVEQWANALHHAPHEVGTA
jgi:uncharacterized protein (UPF0264 family)